MRRLLSAFARSPRGSAILEFAIAAPVLLLFVMGGLEISHTFYVQSVLTGQLQKAARDMSLEDASNTVRQAAIVQTVIDQVHTVVPGADVTIVPRSYHDYANAANAAEEYADADHDGVCDHGETFVDQNRNGHWDADGSVEGRGGARDVVLLVATASYDRLPLGSFFTANPRMRLTATTLIRNQPSDAQADPPTGTCP